MDIPLVDLKEQYLSIKDEIRSAVIKVIESGCFILGEDVLNLEKEIASFYGVRYAVGVASGTDALVLALTASDIGTGDEVITTPFTFIATSEAINRVGAKPVFCDIEYDTYNIDPEQIRKKITSKTKAVLPVHLYGLPCDMDRIIKITKEYNLKLVEDCAQSFGSEYRNRKVGSFGECGCLSFFPSKTLGCYGDGGMIITDSEEVSRKLKSLRNHGATEKYFHSIHGYNSRLDALQAAVLMVKMKHIDNWINRRIENAKYYNELLSGLGSIITPEISNNGIKHSFNYYTIRIKKQRDVIEEALKKNNIASSIYYPLCLHLQEVYKDQGYKLGDFPVTEEAQKEVLSLPMYPELNRKQIQEIVKVITEVV